MEQQLHRACERTKSKEKQNQATSHSNRPQVSLFDLAHKQCNILKDDFTSESKRAFLLEIYINVWMMSGHGANSAFYFL